MENNAISELKIGYNLQLEEYLKEIEEPTSSTKLEEIITLCHSLTDETAKRVYKLRLQNIWKPQQDWEACQGEVGRKIKFLKEEVAVVSRFLNSEGCPVQYKRALAKCISGNQNYDGLLFDQSGETPLCHFEICSPRNGKFEANENSEVRKNGYFMTPFTPNPVRDWGIMAVKDIVIRAVDKKCAKPYPDNTILIIEYGSMLPTESPEFEKDSQFIDQAAIDQFIELASLLSKLEYEFKCVFAINRWLPNQIISIK